MKTVKVGFVGGGNMAAALVAGLVQGGALAPALVRCSEPNEQRRAWLQREFGIETLSDNRQLVDWADCVVLAVKPQLVEQALASTEFGDKLLVSVCAGLTIASLEQLTSGRARVIRAMPNTPALVGAGATALAKGARVSLEDETFARELFGLVGKCWSVSESQLDAVTGLSGSGPAYVMLFIEALTDGGVRSGLPRDVAQQLAVQTLHGSVQLLNQTGEHPAALKDRVTSPAGTTIEGIAALERAGFRHAVIDAVCEATSRSAALGRR